MRAGSLCSGIGGLDLAVVEHHFDAHTVWFAETDPAPSKVLEAHWPGVPNHGDLTTVDWANVEPVDIVTAGYPCGPFSLAGRRKGTDDVRHLWPAVRDAIRCLRPRWVVLENVRGHLSLGFDQVLGDLACLGFDAEWRVVRSSDVGAPHRRARLFVLATNTDHVGRQGLEEPDRQPVPNLEHDKPHRDDTDRRGLDTWGRYAGAVARWETIIGRPAPAPLVPGTRQLNPAVPEWMLGFPAGWVTAPELGLSRAEALRAVGNAVQPQAAGLALELMS